MRCSPKNLPAHISIADTDAFATANPSGLTQVLERVEKLLCSLTQKLGATSEDLAVGPQEPKSDNPNVPGLLYLAERIEALASQANHYASEINQKLGLSAVNPV